MKYLICGDRNWSNRDRMWQVLDGFNTIDTIIEGEARGADLMARAYAEERGIEVMAFPANWELHGKAAGPIRNQQMLKEGFPHIVIAFHNNIYESKGTKDMCKRALKAAIPVLVVSDKGSLAYYDIKDFPK